MCKKEKIKTVSNCFLIITIFQFFQLVAHVNGDESVFNSNDILIIGPRLIRPSQPKILVYSTRETPEEILNFSHKSYKEEGEIEEAATCTKVKDVDFFYECAMYGWDFSDQNIEYINLRASMTPHSSNGSQLRSEEIEQKVSISTSSFQFLTMIQTDKPSYKPGETVKMRIFFIHRDGTAVNETEIQNFHVEIRNNFDEVLDAFSYKEFKPNVFTHTFLLSNEAFEGDYQVHVWTNIMVKDDNYRNHNRDYDDDGDGKMSKEDNGSFRVGTFNVNESISQTFIVEKSKMPEIMLNIQTKRIVRPRSTIELNIAAQYSNGMRASGKAYIYAEVRQNGKEAIRKYEVSTIISKQYQNILIDTTRNLNLINSATNYNVLITVQFVDDFSHEKISKKITVTVSNSDNVKLILDPVEDLLRPGVNFKINVFLKDIDGKFIESTTKSVTMTVTRKYQVAKCEGITADLMYEDYLHIGSEKIVDSVATFEVDVPFNTTSMEFKASYDGIEEKFVVVRNPDIPLLKDRVAIIYSKQMENENKIKYRILRSLSNSRMDQGFEICYVIFIGEQGEMKIEKKTLTSNQNIEFETEIEKWMISSVNMVVVVRSLFSEFIFDATKVLIEPKIKNTMEIKILPENETSHEFHPGQLFEIKLSVNENNDERSSIHLLSVDEKVQFVSNGDEISNQNIKNKLSNYFNKNDYPLVSGRLNERYNDLSKFNAFIITNVHVKDKDCSLVQKRSVNIYDEEIFDIRTKRSEEVPLSRKYFPETFIFLDIPGSRLKNNGYTLQTAAPQAISTFIVSGFIFHPVHGIGIANIQKFSVRKDFFIEVSSPYSIHVGEVMKLNVAAFNRKTVGERVETRVTAEMIEYDGVFQGEYEFVELKQNGKVCEISSSNDKSQIKRIDITNDAGNSTHFLIRAKSDKKIKIKISATAGTQTDTIIKEIIVEPQGRRKSTNEKTFIDLYIKYFSSHSFKCEFPMDIVNSTKKVFATVRGFKMVPFLLGKSETVIKSLPDDSPQQTFNSWASNIVSYNYIWLTGQLDRNNRYLFRKNLQLGYDRLVSKSNTPTNANWRSYTSIQDSSGKFTLYAFDDKGGNIENRGDSLWNSAYMAQLINIGKSSASMNERYIIELLNYAKSKQAADGSFHDSVKIPYYCSHTSSSKIPLTAFIISTFLRYDSEPFRKEIDSGMNYLINQVPNMGEYFDLAITAYAMSMQLKRFPENNTAHIQKIFYQVVDQLVGESDEFGNKMFWRVNRASQSPSKVEAVQVETASYVLLAMLNNENKIQYYMESILKINNWLYSVKNSDSADAHDTVLAFEAMGEVSERFLEMKTNLSIELETVSSGDKKSFSFHGSNADDLQQKQLQKIPTQIRMIANGRGLAFVEISCEFFEKTAGIGKNYELMVGSELASDEKSITINIAARAVTENSHADVLGITLLEVELPNGFEFRNEEQIYKDLTIYGVKKVKLINERKIAVLYFDPLSASMQRFYVKGYLVGEVSSLKSSSVQVYSYKSRDENYAVAYYNLRDSREDSKCI